MYLSRLNTQEALKLSLTPKSYNEQPFPFYIGIPPWALDLLLIRNECHWAAIHEPFPNRTYSLTNRSCLFSAYFILKIYIKRAYSGLFH